MVNDFGRAPPMITQGDHHLARKGSLCEQRHDRRLTGREPDVEGDQGHPAGDFEVRESRSTRDLRFARGWSSAMRMRHRTIRLGRTGQRDTNADRWYRLVGG